MTELLSHSDLINSGWNYLSHLKLYEHSSKTWKDGTSMILTEQMRWTAEWFSDDDRCIIMGLLARDSEFFYLGMWWHEAMFEKKQTKYGCNHDWVNVSFSHIVLVCKNCEQEKKD